ncbi:hypothetical protein McpSp1_01020 [Methanocorpusculaceae archaeon Sp1]|nr:hypothetical protein [Methanocorpusculaceae archaeon Sp1]
MLMLDARCFMLGAIPIMIGRGEKLTFLPSRQYTHLYTFRKKYITREYLRGTIYYFESLRDFFAGQMFSD